MLSWCAPVALAFVSNPSSPLPGLRGIATFAGSSLFYLSQIIVISVLLGSAMLLFLKRFKSAIIIAIVVLSWVYGFIVVGSLILHPGALSQIPANMQMMVLAVYIGDVLAALLFSLYLPTLIAYRRKKKSLKKIAMANVLLAWVPAVWPLLLFISFRD